MNPFVLATREILHRWKSSLMVAAIVAAVTGTLSWFLVNSAGFQSEVRRNVRDIGSNVVILPATVNQFEYHAAGGYSSETMPEATVGQLLEYKASLNHLIPMLERTAECRHGNLRVQARVVGIAASIAMPGRPKAPMQKAIPEGKLQLGSELAAALNIGRDETTTIEINGQPMPVDRVNRSNGTWQDSAAFIDLQSAQHLFGLQHQISRIEAIECTSEQCKLTGLTPDVVLTNELARISDSAALYRRDQIARARSSVRLLSRENLSLLQNVLWVLLALAVAGLTGLNALQRKSEIGVLQAVGYGHWSIVSLFVLRAAVLTVIGSLVGVVAGSFSAWWQSVPLFAKTGEKFAIDWSVGLLVGAIAVLLAVLASSLPAMAAAWKNPAELIGKDS